MVHNVHKICRYSHNLCGKYTCQHFYSLAVFHSWAHKFINPTACTTEHQYGSHTFYRFCFVIMYCYFIYIDIVYYFCRKTTLTCCHCKIRLLLQGILNMLVVLKALFIFHMSSFEYFHLTWFIHDDFVGCILANFRVKAYDANLNLWNSNARFSLASNAASYVWWWMFPETLFNRSFLECLWFWCFPRNMHILIFVNENYVLVHVKPCSYIFSDTWFWCNTSYEDDWLTHWYSC